MPRGRKKKEVAAVEETVEETKPAEEAAEEVAPEEEEVSTEEVSEEETESEEEAEDEADEAEESEESEEEAEEVSEEEEAPAEEVAPEAHTKVKYEHAFVIEVLNDGRHFEDKVHCKMTDGTTKHVPRSLFAQFAVNIPEFAQPKDQEDSE